MHHFHHPYSLLVSIVAATLLNACGANGFLERVTEVCNKYPTPDARADCERRTSDSQDAFKKQKEENDKKQRASDKGDTTKPDGLCFTRQSTGERVCPN